MSNSSECQKTGIAGEKVVLDFIGFGTMNGKRWKAI